MKKRSYRLFIPVTAFLFLFLLLPVKNADAKAVIHTWNDYTFHYAKQKDGTLVVRLNQYNGTDRDLVLPEKINGHMVRCTPETYAHPELIHTLTIPKYVKQFYFPYIEEPDVNTKSQLVNLEEIRVDQESRYFRSIDGVLFDTYKFEKNYLSFYPDAKKDSSYVIPDFAEGSEYINNPYIKTLTIGKHNWDVRGYFPSLETLIIKTKEGLYGDLFMPHLKTVRMENRVKAVGESFFSNCTELESIFLPDSITEIGQMAFSNCTSLKSLRFSPNLTKIGILAFDDCVSLESVSLPDSLKEIERYAFADCTSLKEVTIPESVTKLGLNSFSGCTAKIIKPDYLERHKRYYVAKAPVRHGKNTTKCRAANITKIRPEQKKIRISKKQNEKLKTLVFVKDEKKGILSPSLLTYRSGNPDVIRVTKKGTLKPLKKGNAVIQVTLKTGPLSCKVRVTVK